MGFLGQKENFWEKGLTLKIKYDKLIKYVEPLSTTTQKRLKQMYLNGES